MPDPNIDDVIRDLQIRRSALNSAEHQDFASWEALYKLYTELIHDYMNRRLVANGRERYIVT